MQNATHFEMKLKEYSSLNRKGPKFIQVSGSLE